MKYKTFRTLVIVGGVAAVSVIVYALRGGDKPAPPPPEPAPEVTTTQPVPAAPAPQPDKPAPPPVDADALRPMDREILARVKQGISGDKVKDVFPGKAYKVSLYKDAGFTVVNRVKIDLDRDDRWDEKWTFTVDSVKRQVSPADDDRTYSLEYRLAGERWEAPVGQAAPPKPPEQPAGQLPAGAEPLRAMDEEILARAAKGIAGDREKDAIPGRPWKLSLYKDAGQARVNRAKLDLDRDEKWDEKWTFEGETVKRQVAPADDEVYATEYRLRGGGWVKK